MPFQVQVKVQVQVRVPVQVQMLVQLSQSICYWSLVGIRCLIPDLWLVSLLLPVVAGVNIDAVVVLAEVAVLYLTGIAIPI